MPLHLSERADEAAELLISVRAPRCELEGGRAFSVDLRRLLPFVAERRRIVRLLAESAREHPFDVIAGAGAGLPFAAWLAELVALPLVVVRDGRVEGELKPGQRALLASDVLPDPDVLPALRAAGAICEHVAVVAFDDLSPVALDGRATLHALTTSRRLIESPDIGALFTPAQMKALREFAANAGAKT